MRSYSETVSDSVLHGQSVTQSSSLVQRRRGTGTVQGPREWWREGGIPSRVRLERHHRVLLGDVEVSVEERHGPSPAENANIMLLGNSLCSLVTKEAGHLLCEVFPSNMFATG